MSALEAACGRMRERMGAVGATTEGVVLDHAVEALMFSGLPAASEEIGGLIQDMADSSLDAICDGIHPRAAVKGTLASALLVGYYLAIADRAGAS